MKIYLDNCSLQRPLDSKNQIRIKIEAEAVLGILEGCEAGKMELISSDALVFEVIKSPNPARRHYALEALAKSSIFVALDGDIEKRAREFYALGIKALDALHLASAEKARADYFCTCDDNLLKRSKLIEGLKTKAVSPLEVIGEMEQ